MSGSTTNREDRDGPDVNFRKSRHLPEMANFADLETLLAANSSGFIDIDGERKAGLIDPVNVSGISEASKIRQIIGAPVFFPRLQITKLQNAKILFPQHIVFTENDVVISDLSIWRGDVQRLVSQQNLLSCNEHALVVTNNNFSNYSHWHVETLPAMQALRDIPLQWHSVILPVLQADFQRASSHALRFDIHRHMQMARGFVKFKSITFLSYTDHSRAQNVTWPENIRTIVRRLKTVLLRSPSEAQPRKIYISRRDSLRRRCINEIEFEAGLKKMEFTIVELSDLPYRDQIRIFAHADVVVGLHGAGLNNMIFCNPDTLTIEIQPSQTDSSAFLRLAPLTKQRYALYQQPVDPTSDRHADWHLDVDAALAFVRKCL